VGDLVTIVVPCFDEAGRWRTSYWEEMLAVPGISWIFVDDGSSDDTVRRITSTGCRVLALERNRGKAEAVRRGLLAALEDGPSAVGFMDADGAFNVQDVVTIVAAYGEQTGRADPVDAIWSSRVALAGRSIERHAIRHYIGRAVATVVSVGNGPIPYDTQSGLKLFRPSPTLRACLREPFATRWLFEIEILLRWRALSGTDMRVWEMPLDYWHDVAGSKITRRESVRIVSELAAIKRLQYRLGRRR